MYRIPVMLTDNVYFHGIIRDCSGTTVTSVRSNSDSAESKRGYNWIVDGYENKSGKRFRYRCRKAVLATGTTDLSNHLGVSGESKHPDWVTHDFNDLETRLECLVEEYGTRM